MKTVQPRLRNLEEEAQQQCMVTLASLQQALTGIRDIEVLGLGRAFPQVYRASYDRLARAMNLRGTILDLPRLIIETSLIAFILVLFAVSIASGTATQELLATLGLLAYAGLRIQQPLQELIGGLNSVRYSAQGVDDTLRRNIAPGVARTEIDEDAESVATHHCIGVVIVSPAGVSPGTLQEVTIALECSQVDLGVAPSLFQMVTPRMTIETVGFVQILHVDQIRLERSRRRSW